MKVWEIMQTLEGADPQVEVTLPDGRPAAVLHVTYGGPVMIGPEPPQPKEPDVNH